MVPQNQPVPSALPFITIPFFCLFRASGVLASENVLKREVTEEKGNAVNELNEKSAASENNELDVIHAFNLRPHI